MSISGTRQRSKFAECFSLALDKEIILLSLFSLLTLKLFLLSTYNMWYSPHTNRILVIFFGSV